MFQGSYVFSQIMSLISHRQFQILLNRHNGEYKVKDFTCWKQLLCVAFGQLTHRESLSNTILCLKANSGKLYHLGIGGMVAKSTLTKANENRSYRIYEDLATVKTQIWIAIAVYVLIAIAKKKFMIRQSLCEILQILNISIFEKTPIHQMFQQTQLQIFKELNHNQLNLFE